MRSFGVLTLCACLAAFAASGCGGNRAQQTSTDTSTDQGATQGTATTGNVQVAQVELGKGVDDQQRVTEKTDTFKPGDVVYATVITNGAADQAEIKARWVYENGQLVEETTQTIAPQGNAATSFHVSKPDGLPAGKYRVEILVNGVTAATEEFQVNAS